MTSTILRRLCSRFAKSDAASNRASFRTFVTFGGDVMTTPTCPGGTTGAPLMTGPGVENGPRGRFESLSARGLIARSLHCYGNHDQIDFRADLEFLRVCNCGKK